MCYVCGRSYGVSSYEIHLKQCKALWESQQQKLLQAERNPLPRDPEFVDSQESGRTGIDAQNVAALRVFNDETLEACEHCGRTFLADRLSVHQKSCTSSSPAKPVGAARLYPAAPEPKSANTASRPRTSRRSKTGETATGPEQGKLPPPCSPDVSASGIRGQREISSDSFAREFGGSARRGVRAGQAADEPLISREKPVIELLKTRISRVEKNMIDTRMELTDLRKMVEKISPARQQPPL